MHPAIAAHPSNHFIGAMNKRRKENMGTVLGRLNMLLLLLWSLQQLGVWAGKPPFSIAGSLTYCPTRTMYHMTQCWHGLDAHYLFHCYDLPQCASVAAGPSPTDQVMFHQRWAWLIAPGTIEQIYSQGTLYRYTV